MQYDVITIFPQMFEMLRASQIWKRAESEGKIDLRVHDLRDFTQDTHRTVDDVPYGGGPGMVLKVEPLVQAVESLATLPGRRVLYASPQGRKFDHAYAKELSALSQIVIVCGRYEGVDERFVEGWVDECFSIGDYVVSGGELPAMVLLDAVSRLLPGVVGDWESVASDSFSDGKLKFPQYTRPQLFRGKEVPEVLLSGNHREIERWRTDASLARTRAKRPDLIGEENVDKRENV